MPSTDCARCTGLGPAEVEALEVVGGSRSPCDAPWGELRACPACGAWFRHTFDHDNEIGYRADPPTLDRLDDRAALALAEDALVVARRQHAAFATHDDAYRRRCAADYADEIARLGRAIDRLRFALGPPAAPA